MHSAIPSSLMNGQALTQNPLQMTLRSLQSVETFQPDELFSLVAVVQSVSHSKQNSSLYLQVLDEHSNQGYIVVPKCSVHPMPELATGAVVRFKGLTRGQQTQTRANFPLLRCSGATEITVLDESKENPNDRMMHRLWQLSADLVEVQEMLEKMCLTEVDNLEDQTELPQVDVCTLVVNAEPKQHDSPVKAPVKNVEGKNTHQPEPKTLEKSQPKEDHVSGEQAPINPKKHLTLAALNKIQLSSDTPSLVVSLLVRLKSLKRPVFRTYQTYEPNCSVNHRLVRARNRCKGCSQTITIDHYAGGYEAVAEFTDSTESSANLSFSESPVGDTLFGIDGMALFYRTKGFNYYQSPHIGSVFLIQVHLHKQTHAQGLLISRQILSATKISNQQEADRISEEVGEKFAALTKPAEIENKPVAAADVQGAELCGAGGSDKCGGERDDEAGEAGRIDDRTAAQEEGEVCRDRPAPGGFFGAGLAGSGGLFGGPSISGGLFGQPRASGLFGGAGISSGFFAGTGGGGLFG